MVKVIKRGGTIFISGADSALVQQTKEAEAERERTTRKRRRTAPTTETIKTPVSGEAEQVALVGELTPEGTIKPGSVEAFREGERIVPGEGSQEGTVSVDGERVSLKDLSVSIKSRGGGTVQQPIPREQSAARALGQEAATGKQATTETIAERGFRGLVEAREEASVNVESFFARKFDTPVDKLIRDPTVKAVEQSERIRRGLGLTPPGLPKGVASAPIIFTGEILKTVPDLAVSGFDILSKAAVAKLGVSPLAPRSVRVETLEEIGFGAVKRTPKAAAELVEEGFGDFSSVEAASRSIINIGLVASPSVSVGRGISAKAIDLRTTRLTTKPVDLIKEFGKERKITTTIEFQEPVFEGLVDVAKVKAGEVPLISAKTGLPKGTAGFETFRPATVGGAEPVPGFVPLDLAALEKGTKPGFSNIFSKEFQTQIVSKKGFDPLSELPVVKEPPITAFEAARRDPSQLRLEVDLKPFSELRATSPLTFKEFQPFDLRELITESGKLVGFTEEPIPRTSVRITPEPLTRQAGVKEFDILRETALEIVEPRGTTALVEVKTPSGVSLFKSKRGTARTVLDFETAGRVFKDLFEPVKIERFKTSFEPLVEGVSKTSRGLKTGVIPLVEGKSLLSVESAIDVASVSEFDVGVTPISKVGVDSVSVADVASDLKVDSLSKLSSKGLFASESPFEISKFETFLGEPPKPSRTRRPPLALPGIDEPRGVVSRDGDVFSRVRTFKYQPSLVAVSEGIVGTGKRKKELTGLEIRPLKGVI